MRHPLPDLETHHPSHSQIARFPLPRPPRSPPSALSPQPLRSRLPSRSRPAFTVSRHRLQVANLLQSRHAAIAELQGDLVSAEGGYESSIWLLQALLDDVMYDGGHIRDEDRMGVEKGELIVPVVVSWR